MAEEWLERLNALHDGLLRLLTTGGARHGYVKDGLLLKDLKSLINAYEERGKVLEAFQIATAGLPAYLTYLSGTGSLGPESNNMLLQYEKLVMGARARLNKEKTDG